MASLQCTERYQVDGSDISIVSSVAAHSKRCLMQMHCNPVSLGGHQFLICISIHLDIPGDKIWMLLR